MESVAVLSDIHGVLPALDAVLAEPAVRAADRIVLTGDIAAGPQPGEVLDRLIGLGDRVTWVRGNADRELVELARGETGDVGDPIAQPEQPVKHLARLRPGRDVPGEHDPVGRPHGRLGQHRVKRGQHPVDIGQHGDGIHTGQLAPARR